MTVKQRTRNVPDFVANIFAWTIFLKLMTFMNAWKYFMKKLRRENVLKIFFSSLQVNYLSLLRNIRWLRKRCPHLLNNKSCNLHKNLREKQFVSIFIEKVRIFISAFYYPRHGQFLNVVWGFPCDEIEQNTDNKRSRC